MSRSTRVDLLPHFRVTLGLKMRCGASHTLALVRAFSGVLG
jgi:hypothetical protein